MKRKTSHPHLRKGSSYEEDTLYQTLRLLDPSACITRHDRSLLEKKELDIYIPEYRLAVEFNGNWWHSTLYHKDPTYHLQKTQMCEKQGIHLIQIFEDEWMYHRRAVVNLLRSNLGLNAPLAGAYSFSYLSAQRANQFILQYDIKSFIRADYYIGVQYKKQLACVISLSLSHKEFYIQNIAIKYGYKITLSDISNVLSFFRRTSHTQPVHLLLDRRFFTSEGLDKLGEVKEIPPQCWITRDFETRYPRADIKLAESQIEEWGYYKIYDCGSWECIIE